MVLVCPKCQSALSQMPSKAIDVIGGDDHEYGCQCGFEIKVPFTAQYLEPKVPNVSPPTQTL